MNQETPPSIHGVLVDLAGVLYAGDRAIAGSIEAVQRLREAGLAVRYLTNTTRKTRTALLKRLGKLGFDLNPQEVFTAPLAARQYIEQAALTPYLLIHPDLRREFADLAAISPAADDAVEAADAVLVGDAGNAFTSAALNQALNILLNGGRLVAMGDSRYFAQGERMALDMGPFVHALAYAADVEPVIVGKPAGAFFDQALAALDVPAEHAVMVGDDLHSDVGGAQDAGLRGILVRTGKYRPADEQSDAVRPDHIADDLAAAVHWILART